MGGSQVQDQPGQDGETLSLLKIQKLAERGSSTHCGDGAFLANDVLLQSLLQGEAAPLLSLTLSLLLLNSTDKEELLWLKQKPGAKSTRLLPLPRSGSRGSFSRNPRSAVYSLNARLALEGPKEASAQRILRELRKPTVRDTSFRPLKIIRCYLEFESTSPGAHGD
ncbi:hypothetical protein AAY473_002898 [Plecturocebus cupreus]